MDALTHTNRKDKDQNRAGGPLPIIPRRRGSSSSSTASSSRPSLTPSVSMPLPAKTSLSAFASSSSSTSMGKGLVTVTMVTPATPPKNDSDSSSSSPSSDGSRPTIRTRRARGVRNNGASSTAATTTEWLSPVSAQAQAAGTGTGAQKAFVAFPSQQDNVANNGASTSQTSTTAHASASPSRPLLYTPGMSLRLCVESIKGAARNTVSETHVSHSSAPLPQTSLSTSALYDVHTTSLTTSTPTTTPPPDRIVRKKSGQLVKPSLKTSRSNSLSVYTLPLSSKSEPTTPTSKAVHFDTNLEQIKLFLAEQKPLAVSRDGSPTATDDTGTSGTESDFPGFIFGGGSGGDVKAEGERRKGRRKLVMHLTNLPSPSPSTANPNPALNADPGVNVRLEDMALSSEGTSILGKVLVRNLAYAKHVSVRFTFDAWQTTSEVVGKYVESVREDGGRGRGGWDRFGFTIRVGDLLASIEGKRLEVAVRYVVEGKEFWDNCGGGNYVAWFEFERVRRGVGNSTAGNGKEEPTQQGSPTKKTTSLSSGDEADIKDLKTKLEKEADFRSTQSFAARYDFSSSLKSAAAWNPSDSAWAFPSSAGGLHSRTQSFPLSSSSSLSKGANGHGNGWPQHKAPSSPYAYAVRREGLPPPSLSASSRPIEIVSPPSQNKGIPAPLLGSPRDLDEGSYVHNANSLRSPLGLELGEVPFPVQQPAPVHPNSRTARHHQRGYFDISFPSSSSVSSSTSSIPASGSAMSSSSLRRTPPGTPRSPGEDVYLGSPHRYNSFPSTGNESARSERSSSFSSFTSAALSSSFLRDVTPTPRQQGRPAHGRHHSATSTSTSSASVLRPAEVTSVPMNSNANASSSSTESEESELSTPSMSRESSPEVSPAGLFVGLSLGDEEGVGGVDIGGMGMSMSPDTHYRQFLNKFCFFTGPNSSVSSPQSTSMSYICSSSPCPSSASSSHSSASSMSISSSTSSSSMPRAHSASEIEALLLGISPRLQAIANGTASAVGGAGASPMWGTPSRSPSFDDLVLGGAMGDSGGPGSSGSLTPTPSVSMGLVQRGAHGGHGLGVGGGSQQGTPVLA